MKVYIQAQQDFVDLLQKNGIAYSVKEMPIVQNGDTYNAEISAIKEKVLVTVIASLITSGIKDFVKICMEYIENTHQELVINTENDQYVITQSNVKEMTPIIYNDWVATLSEEKNGQNR